ncbi:MULTISPECIES: T9SS type A sorting domain-containing protein [unclassified Lentimicrobium]|uniref:T9SS type A sorting domain-containing protein n=1 Tax=unclassified Lentimicrobium TaxID=2677434 RepID=UPI0015559435|nr:MULTISPECIES: T9SS type A sorting domain-containing protein [unclassified Lentimicrobium]NPD45918.1 T9SS type A sorting domain-containing protein [Lentimicrobium sp. S6]NPD85927.1 T9SS type A sorting domain-containing protein [Lentimicrobium sp. L6]
MKNTKLFLAFFSLILTTLFSINSYAQTDNYSCNVICLNQPDHIMGGVEVDLFDSNNEFIATTYTNSDGYFFFEDLMIGESYTAKFEYDAENTYVDLADAFTVLSYLYGYIEFDEIQMIAADVTGDGQVTSSDFWTLLFNYYIMGQPLPVGDWYLPDWNFEINELKATGGPAGTVANGTLNTENGDDKSVFNAMMTYTSITELSNEELLVPIYFTETINTNGIGIVLNYNDELIDVLAIESSIEGLEYNIVNDEIRIGWTGQETYKFDSETAVLNIRIKQKTDISVEQIEHFEIVEGTHILDNKGQILPYVNFSSVQFKTTNQNMMSKLATAYPNPCNESFSIHLNTDSKVEVKIYNTVGQMVETYYSTVSNQELQINTRNLRGGLYFYQINYQSKSVQGSITVRK